VYLWSSSNSNLGFKLCDWSKFICLIVVPELLAILLKLEYDTVFVRSCLAPSSMKTLPSGF
jgi:hypothetical protein